MLNIKVFTMKGFKKVMLVNVFILSVIFPVSLLANSLPVYKGVGGDFQMDSTLDKKVSLSDFSAKIVLLSFGYTNCSDVCPVTLSFLNNALNALDISEAEQTQVLFVSVDPDYDTIAHLQKYLSYFNDSFIGLTGSKNDIEKAVKLYNIRYSKTSEIQVSTDYRKNKISKDHEKNHQMHHSNHDTSSLYSHSTYIYLLDKKGEVRGVFDTTTAVDTVAQSITSLLKESEGL